MFSMVAEEAELIRQYEALGSGQHIHHIPADVGIYRTNVAGMNRYRELMLQNLAGTSWTWADIITEYANRNGIAEQMALKMQAAINQKRLAQ